MAHLHRFCARAGGLTKEQRAIYTQYLDGVAYINVAWWRDEILSQLSQSREDNAQLLEAGHEEQAQMLADLQAEAREALEAFATAYTEARDDLDYQSTYRDIQGVWPPGWGRELFDSAMQKINDAFASLSEEHGAGPVYSAARSERGATGPTHK